MTARDEFFGMKDDIAGPMTDGAGVTPSNTEDLSHVTRALWIGGTGDVGVVMASGRSLVLKAVPAATLLPLRVTRVLFTETTATEIIALW